jgi:hypothetical protein
MKIAALARPHHQTAALLASLCRSRALRNILASSGKRIDAATEFLTSPRAQIRFVAAESIR